MWLCRFAVTLLAHVVTQRTWSGYRHLSRRDKLAWCNRIASAVHVSLALTSPFFTQHKYCQALPDASVSSVTAACEARHDKNNLFHHRLTFPVKVSAELPLSEQCVSQLRVFHRLCLYCHAPLICCCLQSCLPPHLLGTPTTEMLLCRRQQCLLLASYQT